MRLTQLPYAAHDLGHVETRTLAPGRATHARELAKGVELGVELPWQVPTLNGYRNGKSRCLHYEIRCLAVPILHAEGA